MWVVQARWPYATEASATEQIITERAVGHDLYADTAGDTAWKALRTELHRLLLA